MSSAQPSKQTNAKQDVYNNEVNTRRRNELYTPLAARAMRGVRLVIRGLPPIFLLHVFETICAAVLPL